MNINKNNRRTHVLLESRCQFAVFYEPFFLSEPTTTATQFSKVNSFYPNVVTHATYFRLITAVFLLLKKNIKKRNKKKNISAIRWSSREWMAWRRAHEPSSRRHFIFLAPARSSSFTPKVKTHRRGPWQEGPRRRLIRNEKNPLSSLSHRIIFPWRDPTSLLGQQCNRLVDHWETEQMQVSLFSLYVSVMKWLEGCHAR